MSRPSTKFLRPILLVTMVGTAFIITVSYLVAAQLVEESARKNLELVSANTVSQLDDWVVDRKQELTGWSNLAFCQEALEQGYLGEHAREFASRMFRDFLYGFSAYEALVLADEIGQSVASAPWNANAFFQSLDKQFLHDALQYNQPQDSGVISQPGLGAGKLIAVAVPVALDGQPKGVLCGIISLDYIIKRFLEPIQAGTERYAILTDSGGRLIGNPQGDLIQARYAAQLPFGRAMMEEDSGSASYSTDDGLRVAAFNVSGETGWRVAVSGSLAGAMAKARNTGIVLSLAGLFLVLAVRGSQIRLGRLLARRNEELIQARDRADSARRELRDRLLKLHKVQDDLKESEESLRDIIENAGEGIFQSAPGGGFLSANATLAEQLGYDSPRDLMEGIKDLGRDLYVDKAAREELSKLLVREGKVRQFEMRVRRKDDSVIWAMINARVVRTEDGRIAYFEGSSQDITARKKAEEELAALNRDLEKLVSERTRDLEAKAVELERANRRLKEMDEMKSAFLSSVSHELRTPLTSVLGFAKLISREFTRHFLASARGDESRRRGARIVENLNIITDEGRRLTRLVNDVLDLNKIESGRMQWCDETMDATRAVRRAVSSSMAYFDDKGEVRLIFEPNGQQIEITADPDRFQQVMVNLISNAAKFTDRGAVEVRICREMGALRVEVSDTGAGIPREDLWRIFTKFHQVNMGDTLARKHKGTGLGLAICRQIVEHYDGVIWVESEPGKGSTFTFEMPVSSWT